MSAFKAIIHFESKPIFGNAGIDLERLVYPRDTQDRFDAWTIDTTGWTGILHPAAYAGVRALAVDVSGDDLRFHLVARGFLGRIGMKMGILN